MNLNLILSTLKRFSPLLIWFSLWTLGILILLPLWGLSVAFPSVFLTLVSLGFLGAISWYVYTFLRGKRREQVLSLVLSLIRWILVAFTLLLAFVALTSSLWRQGLVALLFCFCVLYAKIPHGKKRL